RRRLARPTRRGPARGHAGARRWRSRPVSRILCAGCPAGDHLSRRRIAPAAARSPNRCGPPGSSGGPPSSASCSTLLRTGVAEPRRSPAALVGSYPTVAPLPRALPRVAVSFLLPLREVAPAWLTPASCPVESGLSSSAGAPAAARPAPPRGTLPAAALLGQPRIDTEVREPVRLSVALARDVLVDHPVEVRGELHHLAVERFEVCRLHPVAAGQLLDEEQAVGTQDHLACADRLRSLEPTDRGRVLRHVVGRLAEPLGDL